MVKKLALSASALALLLGGALVPGLAAADTLADAVALAYQTNPNIQAQRAAVRALDESYVQARAGFGVQASGQIGSTYNYNERDTTDILGRPGGEVKAKDYTDSRQLVIAQTLYTGGRLTARLNATEAQIKAGRESLRRAELDLLTRVVAAYVGVRRDEAILRVSEESAAALAKMLQDSEDKYSVRQVTLTDVEQSKARLASARTQVANAKAQLSTSRAQYAAIVGQAPGTLEPEPDLQGLPDTLDSAFDLAEVNSPLILQSVYTEAASRARMAEAKAGRMPQVTGRLDWAYGPVAQYNDRLGNVENYTASITLSQPLYSSGQISSVIRQSVQENVRDQQLLDDARRNAVFGVSQSWDQLTLARDSLVSIEEEMRASAVALYGVREEERFALRSTIEILNAQQELLGAQIGFLRGRFNEYVGRVQLLANMGVLRPETLSATTVAYDPTRNFNKVKWKGALPTEIVTRVLDLVSRPDLSTPVAGDTTPIRPADAPISAAPVEAGKLAPLPSILSLDDPSQIEAPQTTAPKN
ncbi:TolC family outer membrane protein [Caulobacter sp. NIBR2454]|uniref:TolC family outer membrane protein n=1 Tax=Caulobacter sp. NIBR2454 TaxID=3015996 RepID=UPI0022B63D60|nr:TolC family outer membrane protein [Caulobacter sp. NIBR2454]